MKSKPFMIKTGGIGYSLESIRPDVHQFTENWLQELLHQHPNLLPVDEIEPVFWPLVSIGREIPTNIGPIDNLFISKAGYPVLVETKLWRNPEAKREVLAQAIEYASELSRWTFDQFNGVCQKNNQKGVIELIQSTFDCDPEELPTEDEISKNLRLGRFLILVVGDQIRNSLINMLSFTKLSPHLATNVGLVEMQCYHLPDTENEFVIVPSIIARTEIVERSIVQVNLSPAVDHQITVEQIKSEPDSEGRRSLTEDDFWEKLKLKSPSSVALVKKIFDHFQHIGDIELKMREAAVAARMYLPDTSQRLSLFIIGVDGTLECWVKTLISQLENAGIDRELGEEYEKELSNILRRKHGKLSIYSRIEMVDLEAFFIVVDKFAIQVRQSEPGLGR